MSPNNVVEILEVNLPKEMRPHRMEDRFVSWLPGDPIGDPTSYPNALREAIALGMDGSVGFLVSSEDEGAPVVAVALNYHDPLPGILSRRKSKAK